jgi:hypothetical protein
LPRTSIAHDWFNPAPVVRYAAESVLPDNYIWERAMKCAYVNEIGTKDRGDVFVMAGVLVDTYRLRKYTATFDSMIDTRFVLYPGLHTELKTINMINGDRGWSKRLFLRDKPLRENCHLETVAKPLKLLERVFG